jgi:hypothetical protein
MPLPTDSDNVLPLTLGSQGEIKINPTSAAAASLTKTHLQSLMLFFRGPWAQANNSITGINIA